MVYSRTHLGLTNWFTGKAEKNSLGPLAHALQARQAGEIMVKDIHERRHLFRPVTTEQLLALMSKANALHEIIPAEDRRKIYFDIETYNVDRTDDAIAAIRNRWPTAKLAITRADGQTSSGDMKFSRHVVLNLYADNKDDMTFVQRFAMENIDLGFDASVYSRNQAFKCPLMKKESDIRIHEIVAGQLQDLFVTCFFDNCELCEIPKDVPRTLPNIENATLIRVIEANAVPLELLCDIPEDWCLYDSPPETTLQLVYHDKDAHRLNHGHRRAVMGWCRMRGLSFQHFWDWAVHGRSTEHFEQYRAEYDTVPYSRNETMKILLESIYGRKLNTADHRMRRFLHVPIHRFVDLVDGRPALSRADFDDSPVQYVALPMGAGKTETILDMLAEDSAMNDQYRCLFITCRKTLVTDIVGRAKRRDIQMVSYLDYRSKAEKLYEMPKQNIVIVQLESLYCLRDAEKYDTVIIDEVESCFNNWFSLETHRSNYTDNWETFKRHVSQCNRTIFMDAFPSLKTVNFCHGMGLKMNVIGTTCPPPQRKMIQLEKGESEDKVVDRLKKHIVMELNNGKAVYVYYPYKRGNKNNDSMAAFTYHIAMQAGLSNDEVRYYCADTSDKERKDLEDVNTAWRDVRLVVTNNSITVGVSFTELHFDCIYLGFTAWSNGRDVIQNTYRPRQLKENKIFVFKLPSQKNTTTSCQKVIDDPLLRRLEEDVNFETLCPANWDVFCQKAGYEYTLEKDVALQFDLTENEDIFYDWDTIEDITQTRSLEIKTRVMENNATTVDKITVMKHEFKKKFNENVQSDVIRQLWMDNHYRVVKKMFDYVNDIFCEKSSLDSIDECLNHEIWELITFPEKFQDCDYDFKKLDKEQLHRLFEINRIPRKNCNGVLAHAYLINNIFGCQVFKIDSKNQTISPVEKTTQTLKALAGYIKIFPDRHDEYPEVMDVDETVFYDEYDEA
jgi:hypothetical protein